jgi:hypothetical protein
MKGGQGPGEQKRERAVRGRTGTADKIAGMVLALMLPAGAALADPWTLAPGELRLNTTYTYTDAVDALDNDGERDLDGDFYMHELAVLAELGATEYITLFAAPHVRWIDAAGVEEQGLSHTDLGLRLRLFGGEGDVFSIQGHISLPGDIDSIENVRLIQGETEYEVRALYGARFDLHGIPAYFNAEGGYRWRNGGPADEWHGDFAFGWEPQRATEVRIESLNVWGEGQGDDALTYPYFRQHQVRGSLVMHVSPEFALQVGGFFTWDGQNVIAEDGGFVGAELSF